MFYRHCDIKHLGLNRNSREEKVAYTTLQIQTSGERFYNITQNIQDALKKMLTQDFPRAKSGVLHLFTTHTSCALTISEAYDPAAARDVESFFKHIAPRDLHFITHTDEGSDDSPSHMKSVLLNQSLSFIVENEKLILGTWQGIYLAEFRDSTKKREVLVKFVPDAF